jgi:hypothetical protein
LAQSGINARSKHQKLSRSGNAMSTANAEPASPRLCVVNHPLKIDGDCRFVPYNPGIVTRRQQGNIAGLAIDLRAVIHADAHDARDVILKMRCFAASGLGEGLHGLRPLPSGLEYRAPNRCATDLDQFQSALRKFANLFGCSETLYYCFLHNVLGFVG